MGLFDRIANLARGKAKVWKRQRERGADAAEPEVEEEIEDAGRRVTPPAVDPTADPQEEPPRPPDVPPLPKKKRL